MKTRVEHAGDRIAIRMGPVDRLLGLRSRLEIPVSHITSIEVVPRSQVPSTPGAWLRAPGTHIPGLVRYGSYGRRPHREFWAVFRQPEVVIVEVRDWEYHRLVLGSSDPSALAAALGT